MADVVMCLRTAVAKLAGSVMVVGGVVRIGTGFRRSCEIVCGMYPCVAGVDVSVGVDV